MLSLRSLLIEISDGIPESILEQAVTLPDGVLLAERAQTLSEHFFYLSDLECLSSLIAPQNGCALVFVTNAEEYAMTQTGHLCVIRMPLSTQTVHNQLVKSISCWRTRDLTMAKAANAESVYGLLRIASGYCNASYFLFDESFRLVERLEVGSISHPVQMLPQNGSRLTPSQVSTLFSSYFGEGNPVLDRDACKIQRISDYDASLGFLLSVQHTENPDFSGVTEMLREHLTALIRKQLTEYLLPDAQGFTQFLQNIRAYYSRFPEQLMTDIKKLPYVPGLWIRFLLVTCPGLEQPPVNLMIELGSLFQESNLCVYDGAIIIMLSSGSVFSSDTNSVPESIEEILEKHNAFAILSNVSSYASGIRMQYIQCRELLELIPRLRFSHEKRCVNLKRYTNYYMIHLCAGSLHEEFGGNGLLYFAYPEVLSLTRYDQRNKSDLRDFLFGYITNDCNVAQTARALHMHRNTVFYKLNKIKEIVGLTLDSASEKTGLLFSCQILRYMEKIMGYVPNIPDSAMI